MTNAEAQTNLLTAVELIRRVAPAVIDKNEKLALFEMAYNLELKSIHTIQVYDNETTHS